jgi:hypothetical protein
MKKIITKNGTPKPVKLSLTAKVKLLTELVLEIQKKKLHEPDSDYYEYCPGCGNSPNWNPRHKPECLVPRIHAVLKATMGTCLDCGTTGGQDRLRS